MEVDKIEVGEVFSISDDTEAEQPVEVLAKLTIEGTDYVAVSFLEDLSEENEDADIDVFFLKIDENNELAAVESDEEFDKVSEAFNAILDEDEEE
ncbi:DUF1292 domain-containing protein [Radiobacillus sp. PE A8.2]|uniref:DUF1292 domain-containing protein n=1 Tax=Radiobacillus sp. PE A8.2 TaxID=3380349 RepID=UPI003890C5BF